MKHQDIQAMLEMAALQLVEAARQRRVRSGQSLNLDTKTQAVAWPSIVTLGQSAQKPLKAKRILLWPSFEPLTGFALA